MNDKGKRELEAYNNEDYFEGNNQDFPCKKHPSSSSFSGGICAYCLSDRLVQLICPECGEKRLSSSCCSDFISNSNSSIPNVGRISSLLENEKGAIKVSKSKSKSKTEQKSPCKHDDFTNLKRSNTISELVDATNMRKSDIGKLWKIGRLFSKIRENHKNNQKIEEKYECISRDFKGFYDSEGSGGFPVISSAARASSVSTENFVLDSAKISCFSESEARISNFDYCDNFFNNGLNKHNNIFSLKESEFVNCDDSGFIDLKLNGNMSSDHSKVPLPPSLGALKKSGLGLSTKELGIQGDRISSFSERELKKCKKSYKVWRLFFRHQ